MGTHPNAVLKEILSTVKKSVSHTKTHKENGTLGNVEKQKLYALKAESQLREAMASGMLTKLKELTEEKKRKFNTGHHDCISRVEALLQAVINDPSKPPPFAQYFASREEYSLYIELDQEFKNAVRGDQRQIPGTDAWHFFNSYKDLLWSKTKDMAQVIGWMRELLPEAYSAAGSVEAKIIDGRKAARLAAAKKRRARKARESQTAPANAGTPENPNKNPPAIALGGAECGAEKNGGSRLPDKTADSAAFAKIKKAA